MNLKIKKYRGYISLYDEDTKIELMVASKHDLNGSYRIIDYRYTSIYIKPTEYLGDLGGICSIKYEKYLEKNGNFDFPHKIEERNDVKFIRWRDMDGILENGDRKDKVFDFKTESHQWSYEAVQKLMKECKTFWENYDGDMLMAKIEVKNRRPSDVDFY